MSAHPEALAAALGRGVVRVLASAQTIAEAGEGVLREVGEAFGSELGVLWLHDERAGILCHAAGWAPEGRLDELRESFARLTFAPGVGLPGRVVQRMQPAWIGDVGTDPDFPRADAVLAAGLRAALAGPVLGPDGLVGVIEFFSAQAGPPPDAHVEALSLVGRQLGQFASRMRLQERLAHSEEAGEAIVSASLDGIITMDHRGRVLDFNPTAEATFGYEREATIGELLADLIIPPELRGAHARAVRRYVETRTPTILNRRLELEGMRADGSRLPVELTVTRLGRREPPVFAAFIRDITQRREAEQELGRLLASEHDARLRAEQAERATRAVAQTLQRSLLPPSLPAIRGLELGAVYRAGADGWDVGGDFYDVFEVAEDRWAMVMGDVCGKGPQAAAVTAKLRFAVRAAAVRHDSPSAVLLAVNDATVRDAEHVDIFTAILALIDVRGDRPTVCFAAGGHPPPLHLAHDGSVAPVGHTGTLLGAFPAPRMRDAVVTLHAGEALLFYTDGVIETRTPQGRFGVERLAELLGGLRGREAQHISSGVEAAVAGDGHVVVDDLAVVTLRAAS